VSAELFEKLQQFTCAMYAGSRSNKSRSSTAGDNSVNVLRYQLFCAKTGAAESSLLLPCRDASSYTHTEPTSRLLSGDAA